MQGMNWDDLRILLAICRQGSASAAARQLKLDQTTVSRRIARLEKQLDTRLFERIGRQMRPTDAGLRLAASAEEMETRALSGLEGAVGVNADISGTVRVSAVPAIVNHLLIPALGGFTSTGGRIIIELVAEARETSLSRREADIAIRFARPSGDSSVIARRIGSLGFVVCGTAGKRNQPWLTYEDGKSHLPQARWIDEHVKDNGGDVSPLRLNDLDGMIAAVRAGHGRTLLPVAIATGLHGISLPADPKPVIEREVWMLLHPELRNLARIRAVADWLPGVFPG
jgi:DNA-binding transcriptional LysR family regulator